MPPSGSPRRPSGLLVMLWVPGLTQGCWAAWLKACRLWMLQRQPPPGASGRTLGPGALGTLDSVRGHRDIMAVTAGGQGLLAEGGDQRCCSPSCSHRTDSPQWRISWPQNTYGAKAERSCLKDPPSAMTSLSPPRAAPQEPRAYATSFSTCCDSERCFSWKNWKDNPMTAVN